MMEDVSKDLLEPPLQGKYATAVRKNRPVRTGSCCPVTPNTSHEEVSVLDSHPLSF